MNLFYRNKKYAALKQGIRAQALAAAAGSVVKRLPYVLLCASTRWHIIIIKYLPLNAIILAGCYCPSSVSIDTLKKDGARRALFAPAADPANIGNILYWEPLGDHCRQFSATQLTSLDVESAMTVDVVIIPL